MTESTSKPSLLRKSSLKEAISPVFVYSLYGYPRNVTFEWKCQQYVPCFQAIFPFLMTVEKRSYRKSYIFSDWFDLQQFSEKTITDHNMTVGREPFTLGREQRSKWTLIMIMYGETGTLCISFFTFGGKLFCLWHWSHFCMQSVILL